MGATEQGILEEGLSASPEATPIPGRGLPGAPTRGPASHRRHRLRRYLLKRAAFFAPQVLGITFVTFILIRLLPGNPAYLIAGPSASAETIARINRNLGLDRPLLVQFWIYVKGLATGDLGQSFRSGHTVAHDVLHRLPATLELIVPSLGIGLLLGIGFGVYSGFHENSRVDRILSVYARLAGSMPEFWLGLLLIYIFYFRLAVAPPPLGRLGIEVSPPRSVTNSYVLDSLLTGDWDSLASALSHLILPVATFSLVSIAPFMKMTRATVIEVRSSDYIRQAAAMGLPRRAIVRTALSNALPPVVTLAGFLCSYLIGGAVLIETVFGWGGMGQYAVQAIINSDYVAIQGFVLISALFSLLVYVTVDLIYIGLDPRIEY